MTEPLLVYETFALHYCAESFRLCPPKQAPQKREETFILYKGLQAPNIHALRKTIEDFKQSLLRTCVWSSCLETAINEATPNKANKRKTQSHRPPSP